MPNWKKVITSGSDAALNSLIVSYGVTGSLFGTASYALSSLSSSYALSSSHADFATTASYAQTASISLATTENRILVINKSGATITKGMVIHLTGSNNSSDTPYVITASYENDTFSANTLGIASQTIAFNDTGYVTTEGVLTGIDVTGLSSGQLIYLGASGSITGSAPLAPLHAVRLGQVVRDSPSNNGAIYVRIDNGYEIGELHDVRDFTTTGSYGDLLVKSGSIWINSKQLTGSYGATGSLSVIDANGASNLKTDVRTLYDGNSSSSVDWANRQLNATNGSPRLDWRLMYAIDPFTSRSIDWDTRTLQDTAQVTSVSWKNRVLTDTGAAQALNWSLRRAYDSSGAGILSLDWRNRLLHDASTSQSLDWTNRKLYDGAVVSESIDWAQRQLLDHNEIFSILWKDRDAFDANQSSSINWDSRVMRDSGAPGGSGVSVSSIDWESRQAYDTAGNVAIDWSTEALVDTSGNTSINWASRAQYDQSGNAIIDYSGGSGFNIYNSRLTIEDITTAVQDEFTQASTYSLSGNVAGNLINVDTNIDLAVTASNPVFLDTDGIWKRTDQTTDTTTKLLGICVDVYNKGVILSEGMITVTTSSGFPDTIPFVSGSSFYGMPVYLTGSTATFTTDKPTSGYVRVVGHIYYNSPTTPDYWIMKFNPSNDWYEI